MDLVVENKIRLKEYVILTIASKILCMCRHLKPCVCVSRGEALGKGGGGGGVG